MDQAKVSISPSWPDVTDVVDPDCSGGLGSAGGFRFSMLPSGGGVGAVGAVGFIMTVAEDMAEISI
ncbi:hypothetical protein CCR95_00855 [Thiocystis minor]|uniref:hypothetical protein n=1 Tax=Thiocystis minor TaxID=61597 RepID=UPI001912B260|nr:hypothetical protein [Thiocystis minor]MBK5962687.1 hypothetical protein [Thiocystis minor]